MGTELRYSLRCLFRSPGFWIPAVLVIGLSTGASLAVFAVIDTMLLKPLPVSSPETLAFVYSVTQRYGVRAISVSDYEFVRDSGAFAAVAARGSDAARIQSNATEWLAEGEAVTANYFQVLGITPILGRSFVPDDDSSTASPVVIINERTWRNRFSGDPRIIGRTVMLKPRAGGTFAAPNRRFTIVGVVDEAFRGLGNPWEPVEYWVPLKARALDYRCEYPDYASDRGVTGIGRLHRGTAHGSTAVRVSVLGQTLQRTDRPNDSTWRLMVSDSRRVSLPFRGAASVVPQRLAWAFALVCSMVLTIAVANLAGMLLARAVARQPEIELRITLGATAVRLLGGALVESAALAIAGCLAGAAVAEGLLAWFGATLPSEFGFIRAQSVSLDVQFDTRLVVAFIVAGAAITVVAALIPWAQLRRVASLRNVPADRIANTGNVRRTLRRWIVAPQIAFSVALLMVAGVLVRGLLAAETRSQGYESAALAFLEYELPRPGRCVRGQDGVAQQALQEWRRFDRAVVDMARSTPGVRHASTALFLPPKNRRISDVHVLDDQEQAAQSSRAAHFVVGTGYLRTMGIPLLAGRDFEPTDTATSRRVVIVSTAVARTLWPTRSPIGELVVLGEIGGGNQPTDVREVVGVAAEVAPALSDAPPPGAIYIPAEQGWTQRTLVVRYSGDLPGVTAALLQGIAGLNHDVEIVRTGRVDDLIAAIRYPRRLTAILLALVGGIGVVLTSIGLYGLLAYSVRQRVHEIGVRTALGADRKQILSMVIGDGVRLGVGGVAVGLALAIAGSRVASSQVAQLPPLDAGTIVAVILLVLSLVLIASYGPARHAVSIDPADVLRGVER